MVEIWFQMIDAIFFLLLKECCRGYQFLGWKCKNCHTGTTPSFIALTFYNGLDYHNANGLLNNITSYSQHFIEICGARCYDVRVCCLRGRIDPMDPMDPSSSQYTGLIFRNFLGLVDTWVWMDNLAFFLWSLKGHCHGNQLFLAQMAKIDIPHLKFLWWHSTNNSSITLIAAMIPIQSASYRYLASHAEWTAIYTVSGKKWDQ